MMKKTMLMAAAALLLTACVHDLRQGRSHEPKQTATMEVGDFERVELRGSVTVVYRMGDRPRVVMEGPREQLENVEVTAQNGLLTVAEKSTTRLRIGLLSKVNDVVVTVESPDLIGIALVGSGDFVARGLVDTDTLTVVLKGSGDLTVEHLVCDRLDAELVGSGDLELKDAETMEARLSLVGSGDLDARLRNTAQTDLQLLGSGDLEVHFDNCRRAQCNLRGSGDIELSGHLEQFVQQKSGSGDIDTDKLTLRK